MPGEGQGGQLGRRPTLLAEHRQPHLRRPHTLQGLYPSREVPHMGASQPSDNFFNSRPKTDIPQETIQEQFSIYIIPQTSFSAACERLP